LLSPLLQPEHVHGFASGLVHIPPGERSTLHFHDQADELWIVASGEGTATVGHDEIVLGPDTVVLVPKKVPHQIFSRGKEDLKVFFVYVPAGPESMYVEGRLP
jgi:mannose-6-phosphate isomerase-like protein (cupin superfamily)